MEKKFIIDPYKFWIALATIALCVLLSAVIVFAVGDFYGLLFLIPVIPFVYVAYLYGGIISVSPDKIIVKRLKTEKVITWDELRELGVVNTKLFSGAADTKRNKYMYIYFSKDQLSDDERFKMALEWPPKKQDYLFLTKDRIDYIRPLWNKDIKGEKA